MKLLRAMREARRGSTALTGVGELVAEPESSMLERRRLWRPIASSGDTGVPVRTIRARAHPAHRTD